MALLVRMLLLCLLAGGAAADWRSHAPPRLHAASRHLLATKPGPPAKVTVTLSNTPTSTRVLVRVSPPAGSTGAGLKYNVTGYPDNSKLPRLVASGAGGSVTGSNQRQFAITGHQRNAVYRFTARAINSAGAGPEKSPRVVFYECSKYFKDTGTGCKCKVSGTGCQTKDADGCNCKTCLNGYKADGAGGCSKCPAIARCTTYSKSSCACTKCSQFFSGGSCTCSVAATGCAQKNPDGCSCKACSNGYKGDGAGGCSKCPAIARCTTYSKSSCACTQCSQFFSGGSCTCSVAATGCAQKNPDGCSCKACSNGYKGDGKGGCTKCPAVTNCKTYSSTDCRCTACNQYFGNPTQGACQCLVAPTGCGQMNADGCSCKACSSGYMPDGAGGCKQCTAIANCKPFSYSTIYCSCTQCNTGYGSCGTSIPSCATNIFTNSSHCGGCNKPCTNGKTCQSGACACPAGKYECKGVCIPSSSCCTAGAAVCPPANPNCKCTAANSECPQDGGACRCRSGSSYCAATDSCHVFAALGSLPLGAECCPDPSWGNECQSSETTYGTCKAGACSRVIALPLATGANGVGQLGDGSTTNRDLPVSVLSVGNVAKATFLAAGTLHTCVAVNFGADPAMCWGFNLYSQLGDGSYSDRATPAAVTGSYVNLKMVAAGAFHTCGVMAGTNEVACWGWGSNYQLGSGATADLAQPTPIADGGDATYSAVACGYLHTCALRTDGQAVCFGLNADGQCGDPTFKDVKTPTIIGGSYKRLVTGFSHTCGLRKSDSHAECWGLGTVVGGGSGTGHTATPIEVAGGRAFARLSAGDFHTCGLLADGSAYCWGYNDHAQLGTGSNIDSLEPVAVGGGLAFADIAASSGHTCGLLNNGSVACWGWNDSGQLGDGTNDDRLAPTLVDGGRKFTAIAAGLGASHTLFLP